MAPNPYAKYAPGAPIAPIEPVNPYAKYAPTLAVPLAEPTPPPAVDLEPPTFGESFGRGVDITQQLGYGAVEATGELVGSDTLSEFGKRGRERNIKEGQEYGHKSSVTDIGDVGDFLQWAKETAGEQIPLMAGPMAGGLAGAGLGAAIGGPAAPITATIGGIIGAFVPSLVLGVGETQSAIKEKDPNAVAPGYAFAGGTAIAALDSALPGRVGSALIKSFGRETAEEIAKDVLTKPVTDSFKKYVAKEGAKGIALEGITESIQESISEIAAAKGTGQEIDWEGLKTQMIEAAAAGSLMGGATNVVAAPFTYKKGEPEGDTEEKAKTGGPQKQAPITAEDEASPIDSDLIAEGTAIQNDVAAGTPDIAPNAAPVDDTPLVTPDPAILLKRDGSPFPTKPAARTASKQRKDLKGRNLEIVEVEGGYGLQEPVLPQTEAEVPPTSDPQDLSGTPPTVQTAPAAQPSSGGEAVAVGEPTDDEILEDVKAKIAEIVGEPKAPDIEAQVKAIYADPDNAKSKEQIRGELQNSPAESADNPTEKPETKKPQEPAKADNPPEKLKTPKPELPAKESTTKPVESNETPPVIDKVLQSEIATKMRESGLDRGVDKMSASLADAIDTGTFHDLLRPDNKISRRVFAEITGVKLPKGLKATQDMFTGEPFSRSQKLAKSPEKAQEDGQKAASPEPKEAPANEPTSKTEQLDEPSSSPLEGAPAEPVQEPGAKRGTGSGATGGSRTDGPGPDSDDGQGSDVRRGVPGGKGNAPVSARGSLNSLNPPPDDKQTQKGKDAQEKYNALAKKLADGDIFETEFSEEIKEIYKGLSGDDVYYIADEWLEVDGNGARELAQSVGVSVDTLFNDDDIVLAAEAKGITPADIKAYAKDGTLPGAVDEVVEEAIAPAAPDEATTPGHTHQTAESYEITAEDRLGEGGEIGKYTDNIDALQVLKGLEEGDRQATAKEQAVLVRYVGWGGLKSVFPDGGGEFKEGWKARNAELQNLITQEEYEQARRSVLDSHYTSETVVRGIYDAIRRLGFTGGRVLEPSMGTGNFFGLMPRDMRGKSDRTGVELDSLTGKIAKHLYQRDNVLAPMGFQAAPLADDYFDVAVGNPPFGPQAVPGAKDADIKKFSIHNYFFARTLNKLRPGGVMAMVVTKSFLDKAGGAQRSWIAERANFVGAIRLPNTAFKKNARTEVTTDIIFLQKKDPGVAGGFAGWTEIGEVPDPSGGDPIPVNQYFIENPEMMLGKLDRTGSMYGTQEPTLADDGRDLGEAMAEAIAKLPADIFVASSTAETTADLVAKSGGPKDVTQIAEGYDIGSFFAKGNKLYRRESTGDGSVAVIEITEDTQWTEKTKLGKQKFARLVGLSKVRDAARNVIRKESGDATDAQVKESRKFLNQAYDAFVKKHGLLNDRGNALVVKDDPDAPLLLALENGYKPGISANRAKNLGIEAEKPTAQKADIFNQRVIPKWEPVTSVDNATDALVVSLAELGGVNIPHMANISGKTEDEITQELFKDADKPLIYFNPETDAWEPRDIYLSGNVKAKEYEARRSKLKKNADDLRAIFPEDLKPSQIKIRFGAHWVDPKYYRQFIEHLLGEGTESQFTALPSVGGFDASISRPSNKTKNDKVWGSTVATEDGSTREVMGADRLIPKLINNRDLTIRIKQSDGSSFVDKEGTEATNAKALEIREEFQDWVMRDLERREALTEYYNEHYNTDVDPVYDGSHINLPGKNPMITMRRHQRNAIWRIVTGRTALLDHVVGSGKTFTIIAAAMELRRTGFAKKNMVVVPNHLVTQWAQDFYKLYPGAKLLTMSKNDFSAKNRRKMLSRIATGDWDAVIIAHSSFGFIGVDPAEESRFLTKQVAEIQMSIDAMRAAEGQDNRRVSAMERSKETMRAKIAELQDAPKDSVLTFEELGVDQVFVDESQEFKNLFFTTGRRGMLGLGNPLGSKKAFGMFIKTQWLLNKQGGKGVVFATGTPISNSLSEMYSLQRYLGLPELESRGILSFDAWLSTFGDAYVEYEISTSGLGLKRVDRLRKLSNMPSLMAMYKQYADSVTQKDVNEAYLEENDGAEFPIPKVKGGERQPVVIEASELQIDYMDAIVERAENLDPSDPKADNMLKITSDARKAALDMRLIDPSNPENPEGKTVQTARRVKDIYDKWTPDKGTQLVFTDLSIPLSASKREGGALTKLLTEIAAKESQVLAAERTGNTEKAITLGEALEKLQARLEKDFDQDTRDAIKSADAGFSVQDDLKAKLIGLGIPENEIAFIHDAKTDKQKADLFDRVNAGKIRVLIGTSAKMGAGTNVQQRLVALHHMDIPWRPSDIEQREGRVIRQGNLLYAKYGEEFEVEILAYVGERSFDARMWDIQEKKLIGIENIRNYNGEIEMEDVAPGAASAADMKAAASGNPLILEDVQLDADIRKLKNQKRSHEGAQQDIEGEVAKAKRLLGDEPERLPGYEIDSGLAQAYQSDPHAGLDIKPMELEGKVFPNRVEFNAHLQDIASDKEQDALNSLSEESKRILGDAENDLNARKMSAPAFNKLYDSLVKIEPYKVTLDGKEMAPSSAYKAAQKRFGDVDPMSVMIDGVKKPQISVNGAAAELLAAGNGKIDGAKGTIGGLPWEVTVDRDGKDTQVIVFVKGKGNDYQAMKHLDPKASDEDMAKHVVGMVTRVTNYIESRVWRVKQDLERAKKDLPQLEDELGKEFPKLAELNEKIERHAEVRRLLLPVEEAEASKGGTVEGYSTEHPQVLKDHESDVGGNIVYSNGTLGLLEGFSQGDGMPVYVAVLGTSRAKVDIDTFVPGENFTAEQMTELKAAKKKHIEKQTALEKATPDGPWKGSKEQIVASESVSAEVLGVARDWAKMMGIKDRIFITAPGDVNTIEKADKLGLYGPFSAIRRLGINGPEGGSTQRLSNGDHYVALKERSRKTATLETLAHEMGHIFEKTEWKNAPKETQNAVIDEYRDWLDSRGEKNAGQWVDELRAHTMGKLAQGDRAKPATELSSYWHSFSEYFADQMSKYATMTETGNSVVAKFFKRIASVIQKLLMSKSWSEKYGPRPGFKAFMDKHVASQNSGQADLLGGPTVAERESLLAERANTLIAQLQQEQNSDAPYDAADLRLDDMRQDLIDTAEGMASAFATSNNQRSFEVWAKVAEILSAETEKPVTTQDLRKEFDYPESQNPPDMMLTRFDTREKGTDDQERAINKAINRNDNRSLGQKIADTYANIKARIKDEFIYAVADSEIGLRRMGQALEPTAQDRELGSYVAASLSKHINGQIEAFLRFGAAAWNDESAHVELDTTHGGLFTIVQPLYEKGLERLFDGYAYARRVRTQGLIDDGREHNLSEAEVDELLVLGDKHPELVEVFDKVQWFMKKALDAVEDMGLINDEQRRGNTAKGTAGWEHMDHVPFYRAIEDESITGPRRKGSLAGQTAGIKRLTGKKVYGVVNIDTGQVIERFDEAVDANTEARRLGADTHDVQTMGQPIPGIIENVAKNFTHLLDAAMKNHAAVMAVDEAVELGLASKAPMARVRALVPHSIMAKALEESGGMVLGETGGVSAVVAITSPVQLGNGIVQVRRDGNVEYYEVDDSLVYRGLVGLYRSEMGGIAVPLRALKVFLTRSITAMPGFMARNWFRDSGSSWLISEERSLNFHGEMLKSFAALGTSMNDPKVQAMMAAGGDVGFYQNAPEDMVKQLRAMEADGRATVLSTLNPKKLWRMWERVGRASELANRVVTYDAATAQSANVREGSFAAADLMDFQKRGGANVVVALTTIVPFMNARIQGLYKLGRVASTNKPAVLRKLLLKGSMMMSFSLLLAAINMGDDDDDGYNDLPEWVKDGSWVVNNWRIFGKEASEEAGIPRFLLIPKPFEVGVIFGTLPERMLQLAVGNDRGADTGGALLRAVADTFAMNPAGNPLTKEIIEQWSNRDFFTGMPIESMGQERLPVNQRAGVKTTETAKAISEGLGGVGESIGASPARIEHMIRGFTGTLGTYTLAALDAFGRAVSENSPEKPEMRLDEIEIIRSFVSMSPARGSKWSERFYEIKREADQIWAGVKAHSKEGNPEAARALIDENRGLLSARKGLGKVADTLSKIRLEQARIRRDMKMTPKEKRDRLDSLLVRKNAMAKAATQRSEKAALR